jgi:hypothetical protein
VLGVAGSAMDLAMDGPWVAVHSERTDEKKYSYCEHVAFWNVLTGKIVRVHADEELTCIDEGEFVAYLGFAGRRAVWTNEDGGRYPVCTVLTATIDAPKARVIPECTEDEETGYGSGEDAGAWVGDGPLLVGNTLWGDPGCSGGCPESTLVRVRPGRLQTLRKGDDFVYVRSVDAGRIVLLRDDGNVAVVNSGGGPLLVLAFAPKEVKQVAIQGADLAVKKAASVEAYDAKTGRLRKTWKLRAGSIMTDLHARIAVLVRGKRVQLLRLSDGHGASYSASGEVVTAQLEAPGLVYAFDAPHAGTHPGRIVFVPLASVLRQLG